MGNTTTKKDISLHTKIDMIFKFLFENKNALEEEKFWNKLEASEIKEIKKIRKEKTNDFSKLKTM